MWYCYTLQWCSMRWNAVSGLAKWDFLSQNDHFCYQQEKPTNSNESLFWKENQYLLLIFFHLTPTTTDIQKLCAIFATKNNTDTQSISDSHIQFLRSGRSTSTTFVCDRNIESPRLLSFRDGLGVGGNSRQDVQDILMHPYPVSCSKHCGQNSESGSGSLQNWINSRRDWQPHLHGIIQFPKHQKEDPCS